jgi:formylglycine-generating enzyme required for sulfatase activity
MKRTISFFFILAFLSFAGKANNVQISNISILNNGTNNIQVQFDLSWDNSWRINVGQNNYDGVWVFFKYKTATGNWTHLIQNGNNNVVPAGVDYHQNNEFLKAGTMFYRDVTNMGSGTMNVTGIKLGVSNTLPYNIDVKGFAVEMVYIPAPTVRPFFGDGNGVVESQNAFHYTNNTATTGSVVPMEADANIYDDAELDADGMYIYSNDTIQKTNPLGTLDPFPTMKALWCMKYEISQGGYRDFLNTLSLTQQTERTTAAPSSPVGTKVLPPGGNTNRNYIEIETPSAGSSAVYGCDAGANNVFNEADDGEWVACNFLIWPDVAAYLDWAGLAPISEFQYERVCRGNTSAGPNPAVYGEFAWGTPNIYSPVYVLNAPSTSGETITNSTGTDGNANWQATYPLSPYNGPVRNGIFATPTSDRVSSGAAFYGVMEMTGNVNEYCVTVGTEAGRSVRFVPNGNGTISADGNAQLSVGGAGFWPGMEGNVTSSSSNTCAGTCEVTGTAGIMMRGGAWNTSPSANCTISFRSSVQPSLTRNESYGGRGVLYIR